MGFFDIFEGIKDGVESFVDAVTDDTDWDYEHSQAMDSYNETVERYKSYAKKLQYRYSMIRKNSESVRNLCVQIKKEKSVLQEMLTNENAMKLLNATDRNYLENYEKHIKPIKVVTDIEGCKPNVRPDATQWNTSSPSLEDGVAFALLGPLGVLMNRAPTGYRSYDVEEVLDAKSEVVKQIASLKRRITSATKKQSQLKVQEKICKIILQKIEWYKNNYQKQA